MQATAAAAVSNSMAGAWTSLRADPLGLPVGLQLYTVGSDMQKDFQGTLKRIATIGYRSLEGASLASLQGRPAADYREAFSALDLEMPSAHVVQTTMSDSDLTNLIKFCSDLGLQYMVCATAQIGPRPTPPPPNLTPEQRRARAEALTNSITLDDYKQTADQFNKIGEQIAKAGMKFAYHNHASEFRDYNGTTGFDALVANSDKNYVNYELDCGWAVYAGQDPVALIDKYPERIKMLHIKDEKPGYPATTGNGGAPTTEIGKGKIDWVKVFQAAKSAKIEHYFVEQEPPFSEMPPLDAIKVSYDYIHSLKV